MGLNAALATAGRSLEVFTAGMQVAGQNVANANTPGYIREELLLEAAPPYRKGALILGTGVLAVGVQQQIDLFLESRIHRANSDLEAARARESIFKQLETQLRELGEGDLSTSINRFLAALEDVVNQPESQPLRQIAVLQGQQLAGDIASLRTRIDALREAQTINIESLSSEANSLIDEIVRLNPQIAQLEASGLRASDAGALRSQRYEALTRLSQIMPVRFRENNDGSVDVFTASDYLIMAGTFQHLETENTLDRGVQVQTVALSKTGSNVTLSGGELRGIAEGRDDIAGGFVDELDRLTSALIFEFNRIHSSGEGLAGYASVESEARLADPALALNAAGLANSPQHGSFEIKVVDRVTGTATTARINVDLDGIGADTTLEDLRAALDGLANVTATITTQGRLRIAAAGGFEVRFANDSSGALAALGINTFFTGANSVDIGVNALVLANPDLLATGRGGGPGDGRNAVALAGFIDNPLSALGGQSLDDFYNTVVASVAQGSASETTIAEGFAAFHESLQNQRDQFSGVSLDEEAIKILQFQRAFQSSARLISVVDELFRTLLSM